MGDYGDAIICHIGGFMATLLKECPFLCKTTYINKLLKKENICLLSSQVFPMYVGFLFVLLWQKLVVSV